MIRSLLIANRGEIAVRVIRTARRLGIRTIAVYSEADAQALQVAQADEAVAIGPAPARESYLSAERILAAAQATGAEAIHPGYGFLSENADFAEAAIAAGRVWVGPPPAAIRTMGLKDAAKRLMQQAGVPVTPGYLGEDQSAERLAAEAQGIGWPILVKAVAGGGGKGMRRVDRAEDFADALAACRREAVASFGDDRVLLEKYILSPRHIEVQIFGDGHGNVVHLFERDCSLQRRHQKVIEEAPAPGMDEATRAAVCAAAVRAGAAVGYAGAGTVEFIADASAGLAADRIWFMEMNTRLQVEHPVTEAITGIDLVEWQLRVASGEPLPRTQDQLAITGHAIEARLYAEDPANGFLPSVGRLEVVDWPDGVRVDTGVSEGGAVSPFYDPMIAKLIAHADTRDAAADALAKACRQTMIAPVRSNAWFLSQLLALPAFRQGAMTTNTIEANRDALTETPQPSADLLQEAARSIVDDARPTRTMAGLAGFRLNRAPERGVRLQLNGQPMAVVLSHGEDRALSWWSRRAAGGAYLFEDGAMFIAAPDRTDATASGVTGDGAILAPMPGRITAVAVQEGEAVTRGQTLVTLEAMKMEHALVSPFDGTVTTLPATAGAQVQDGALLVRVEAAE